VVSPPFKLTSAGVTFGLTDPGDDNCCATHNSFAPPPSGSALVVLETDSKANAETLIAKGASIGGGGITGGGGTTVPEPASVMLFATGLAGLLASSELLRRRKAIES
ncbi:MAG: PEP-CTERM sorting domain-containing protein, partial [Terriglobia bacterium]